MYMYNVRNDRCFMNFDRQTSRPTSLNMIRT